MLTHNNPDKYRPALDAAQAHNAALTRELDAAIALLRRVSHYEILHTRYLPGVRCALYASGAANATCTCGQWQLDDDIDTFLSKHIETPPAVAPHGA